MFSVPTIIMEAKSGRGIQCIEYYEIRVVTPNTQGEVMRIECERYSKNGISSYHHHLKGGRKEELHGMIY